jgi:hypothetical protein
MSKWAIDLSCSDLAAKIAFLEKHSTDWVLLDVTSFDPTDLYAQYPQLKGVCSTLLSHNQSCEAHFRQGFESGANELQARGFRPVLTNILGPGLVVARTLSTVINEAFYAREEGTASEQDIDRAMRFGVNYPRGPFAWVKGREIVVVRLLETLLKKTGDERYRPAASLVEASRS